MAERAAARGGEGGGAASLGGLRGKPTNADSLLDVGRRVPEEDGLFLVGAGRVAGRERGVGFFHGRPPERVGAVADGVARDDDDDGLAVGVVARGDVEGALERGPRRGPAHEAHRAADVCGGLDGVGGRDVAPLVDDAARRVAELGRRAAVALEKGRVDARRPADDAVRLGRRAGVDARLGRFEGDDLDRRLLRLEVRADARDAAARADAVDEDVDGAARLLPDLGPRRDAVDRGVVGVGELVRPPVLGGMLGDEALEVRDRPGRAEGRIHQVHLGAELAADRVPLEHRAHLGHDDDALVPERGGDHGVPDARVPTRKVDDCHAGPEVAALLGLANHVQRDAVLETAAGVLQLELGEHRRVPRRLGQRPVGHAHERRVPDRLEQRRRDRRRPHDVRRRRRRRRPVRLVVARRRGLRDAHGSSCVLVARLPGACDLPVDARRRFLCCSTF
mmetsp:Transcript_16718/g.67434  ORF Transcript_16718/g.67434 Transcript_16718/m.67434 type:complete len:449 (-) Transcript_16718:14-1360(-)